MKTCNHHTHALLQLCRQPAESADLILQAKMSRFRNIGEPAERCRKMLSDAHKAADSRFFSPWRSRSRFA